MIISIDAEKASDKTQHPFMIKKKHKQGIDGNFLNLMKSTKNLHLTSIHTTHREKAFSLISGTKPGCLLLPLLFDIVLKVLARAIKQEKNIKVIQIRKVDVRLYQFTDDTILYIENSMEFIQTHTHKPTTRSKFSKIAGYKINIQKSTVFQTSVVVQWLANEGDTGSIPALGRFHMPWGNEAHGPQ